jgi:ribose-phosphate pyrophosphokinase
MRQHITYRAGEEYPEFKYVLNLDKDFTPIFEKHINLLFETFVFQGGEPHFTITSKPHTENAELIITQRYNKIDDLFQIIMANDAAKRMGFKNISLVLPYFPAARQDRVCNSGEPLTVKVFTDMINDCGFDEVTILSPHSEVTPALLNNVKVLDELKYVEKALLTIPSADYNIICPDAGAGKRVSKVVNYLSNKYPHTIFNLIRCEKERDVKDGSLKGFFVGDIECPEAPNLIVDDINCKGGTFIGLANKIREKSTGTVSLFTSHSDCQEGIENVLKNLDFVFTTNSKKNWNDFLKFDRLKCFNIEL